MNSSFTVLFSDKEIRLSNHEIIFIKALTIKRHLRYVFQSGDAICFMGTIE